MDFEQMACYEGHITIDAFNCICGHKYVYYGILSRRERISNPRAENNYLKYTALKDVECDRCKKLMYEKLQKERQEKSLIFNLNSRNKVK